MTTRCGTLAVVMLTALACGLIACGGSSPASPTANAPISPAPASLPPVNFSLEARADHFLFSSRLAIAPPNNDLNKMEYFVIARLRVDTTLYGDRCPGQGSRSTTRG